MTSIDTSEMVIEGLEGYELQDERQPCPECGKLTSPRGMTRHRNSAHGAGIEPKQSSGGSGSGSSGRRRTRKTKGVTSDVQDGLSSLAGKLIFGLTLFIAWYQLRQANIHDPDGSIADQLAMTDDEAAAIGRLLSRVFVNTEQGKRLAPVIVENEDVIDVGFAMFEWYKRNRSIWDELENRGYIQKPVSPQNRNTNGKVTPVNGSHGPTESDRQESPPGYVPPSPIDFLGDI